MGLADDIRRQRYARAATFAALVMLTASCRRSAPTPVGPEPADAFIADAGPTEADCLASCRAGVCSACPTVDVSTGATSVREQESHAKIALVGRRLAWGGNEIALSHHDVCSRETTPMVCPHPNDPDCFNWRLEREGLYYVADDELRLWSEKSIRRVLRSHPFDQFGVTVSGQVFATGAWEDHLSHPWKDGFFVRQMTDARDPPWLSSDSLRQFLIDGDDVYYSDGSQIKRVGADGKSTTVVDYKSGEPRAAIATSDGTLFVARGGDLVNWPWFPKGNITVEAVRDGVARDLFSVDAIYCFAANRVGALVCRDQDLQFYPFSSGKPRRALGGAVEVPPKPATLVHPMDVALSDDGGIAWLSEGDRKTIHVRTPPRSVLCGGPNATAVRPVPPLTIQTGTLGYKSGSISSTTRVPSPRNPGASRHNPGGSRRRPIGSHREPTSFGRSPPASRR